MGGVGVHPYIGGEICLPGGEQRKNGYHGYHAYQVIQKKHSREGAMATAREWCQWCQQKKSSFQAQTGVWTPFGLHRGTVVQSPDTG
jgi:hypothetical protein